MFLPNFTNLRVKRQPREEFIVDKNGQQISLSKLSHGEKMTIAMIGDIAKKLSSINLNNPLNGRGVVIIDEIEQHLHPAWQRTIIPNLRRTFPNIQFILTTHSPQVLSNVPRENVFVLEDFKLVKTPHTFGRDSNSMLWELFGVRERPEEAQKDFSKLSRLLDDPEKEEEAKELLTKLSEKYGEDDTEVVRARLYLEFLTES
jgi:predicted ATP-binding protein involved in virulence